MDFIFISLNIAEIRAALDSYINHFRALIEMLLRQNRVLRRAPRSCLPSPTNSSTAITSSAKPTDISHLIKRKRSEEPTSEAAAATPAKR
uniref:Uncharacterized protein n=1 Tax=Glossina morsitans morsitans TaxID=37546 RepID=A0A1B0G2N5_GLOMM